MTRRWAGCGLAFLLGLAAPSNAQDVAPVAWWSFDAIHEGQVDDAVGRMRDPVSGYRRPAPGVVGQALALDGYTTHVVRAGKAAPPIADGLTVEAWVALAAYPWNWAPILSQADAHRGGYELAIGPRGEVMARVMVDGRWRVVEAPDATIPLRRWTHVAAAYDRTGGLTLYANGRAVATLRFDSAGDRGGRGLTGRVQVTRTADIRIGMSDQKRQPSDWHRDVGTQPTWYALDGLLDEVKLYDVGLTASQVARAHAAHATSGAPALAPRVMPSGPPGPGRFGAYHTRLQYEDGWDALWQVGPHPDIVVRFDRSPVRLVFWRGTQYGPAWVTENNLWMADQSVEGYDREATWEHMNDKQNRYSHVRVVEQSDARVVIHWRYAPVDVRNQLWNVDATTGNGTWIDEYYTVYPDAMGVRHVTWRDDRMAAPVQFQESLPLAHPGQLQGDVVHPDYVTIGNLRGETQVFSYVANPAAQQPARAVPDAPTIQMHNLKSTHKPFIAFELGNKMGYLRDMDIRALARPGSSNHWPVAQIPSDGRTSQAPDGPSHFLGFPISTPVRHKDADGRGWWAGLYGMTDQPFSSVVATARSWAQPPDLRVDGGGFTAASYSRPERAYTLRRLSGDKPSPLVARVQASEESPVRNVAIVVENWGDTGATLTIDGRRVPRGTAFRYGLRHTLTGVDLVAWIALERTVPVTLALTPASPAAASR